MSPDEDALLNGIAADPAADLPRLVYADWLEEHGQELRAEFIRIQCEIAKLEVGPRDVIDRNVNLWRRQQELLDGHMGELLEGVPYRPANAQGYSSLLRRGFVDEIEIDSWEFARQRPSLTLLRPVPANVIVTAEGEFYESAQICDEKGHNFVTSLRLFGPPERDGGICFDQNMEWLRLRSLFMIGHSIAFSEIMDAIRWYMPALDTINFADNTLTDNDVIDLLNAGVLQRLSHISLIENAIGDQAAIELADRLGNSPNLKELDLRRNGITTVGQAALLARLGSKVILF